MFAHTKGSSVFQRLPVNIKSKVTRLENRINAKPALSVKPGSLNNFDNQMMKYMNHANTHNKMMTEITRGS